MPVFCLGLTFITNTLYLQNYRKTDNLCRNFAVENSTLRGLKWTKRAGLTVSSFRRPSSFAISQIVSALPTKRSASEASVSVSPSRNTRESLRVSSIRALDRHPSPLQNTFLLGAFLFFATKKYKKSEKYPERSRRITHCHIFKNPIPFRYSV